MYLLILTKMGCATFWAIFSITHLVTLPANVVKKKISMERSAAFSGR
jgi:hypothetical protein